MHKEILTPKQSDLLKLVKKFANDFGLVGGTAVALHIGHRRSVDFDLFSLKPFDYLMVRKKILETNRVETVFVDRPGEITVAVDGVKMTFFYYPFGIKFNCGLEAIIKLPDLLTLAAMKAYALGRRAKWKDYVDLYFIMENQHSIDEIIKKAKEIFKNEFNEKIFRVQLAYFQDIDYSEKIIFMKGFEVKDNVIKRKLKMFSISKS